MLRYFFSDKAIRQRFLPVKINKKVWGQIGLMLTLLLISACSSKKDQDQSTELRTLARVGAKVITVRDFRYNYENGFGHLKTGPDHKRTYLNYMINEKILTLEGYRLGLENAGWIKASEQKLLDELLIEELINREVKRKITVSREEIREAINQSKVSFKFRYWTEPSFTRAQAVAEAMRERGYAEVVDEKLRSNPERRINPKELETDYLNSFQVSENLLNAIKDLPYGEISDPVELNGQYFIFQVLDIRREAVTENEYDDKATTFEQAVFQHKLEKELIRYGTNLMQPKAVVTKGEAFKLLANACIEWSQIEEDERGDFLQSVNQATEEHPALKTLRDNFDQTFVTFKGGSLSVEEFLKEFDAGKISKWPKGERDFIIALNNAVGRTIRDYFLVSEAVSQGLEKAPRVQEELAMWRDKWVFEEARRHFTQGTEVSDKEVGDYFQNFKNNYRLKKDEDPQFSEIAGFVKRDAYDHKALMALNQEVTALKNHYPVEINEAILDTIKVVEFQKSRWATLQTFKTGTNRLAYPVVDPRWGGGEENR